MQTTCRTPSPALLVGDCPVGQAAEPACAMARPAMVQSFPISLFPGIPESDMTPAVRGVLKLLADEVRRLHDDREALRARLTQAETLADADPLVPLRNRRSFFRELDRMVAYADRQAQDLALLMLDLDGLKPINDRGGHAAGDAAIRQVAETLIECTRASDLVGRLGGDEFGVVLMDMGRAGAEQVRARIQHGVSRRSVALPDGAQPLSVSCGICVLEPGLAVEEALVRADEDMYRHKRARRARLVS